MAADFTVIRAVRARFGDQTDVIAGETNAPNLGGAANLSFNCPKVNPNEMAVLQFESVDVTLDTSRMSINGTSLSAPLRRSPGVGSTAVWTANVVLIDKGVLKATDNVLRIDSRDSAGGTTGNRDDFVIDNLVVFYKTT